MRQTISPMFVLTLASGVAQLVVHGTGEGAGLPGTSSGEEETSAHEAHLCPGREVPRVSAAR